MTKFLTIDDCSLLFLYFWQAHDCPVRTMVWSHNDNWMVTGDHQGNVKYWQSNMNNVRAFQAHKDPVRGIRYKAHHYISTRKGFT